MIDQLIEWDTQFLLFLNSYNNLFLDPVIKDLSGRWIWIPTYAAIAFLFWKKYGWKRALILILAVGAAVALSDFTTAKIIRPYFERLRPANLENPISAFVHIVENYRGGRYGFPSCHASNSFALAMASSLILKDRYYSCFIFIWALFQCYSRIYLGVHYPGDLLFGALIGSLFGCLLYAFIRKYSLYPQGEIWHGLPAIAVAIITVIFADVSQLISILSQ